MCFSQQSQTLQCASYKCNSLWCLKILKWKLKFKSKIVKGTFFNSDFFCKTLLKIVMNTKKRDIWCTWLYGVHSSTELSSPVCITPWSQLHQISQKNPLCVSQRGVKLLGVLPTTESDSAVSIPLRSQAPWCASQRRVELRSVHNTAESNCTLRSQIRNLCESLDGFKGTVRRNPLGVNTYYIKEKIWRTFFICSD